MTPATPATCSTEPRPGLRAAAGLAGAFVFGCLLLGPGVATASEKTGTVAGRIRFEGTPPTPPTITMTADPACDAMFPAGRPAEVLLVSADGGLANVIVHVVDGLPEDYQAPPVPAPAVMDQQGCAYVPHVIGLRTGQELEVRNGDSTLHNVDARPRINNAFNEAMPVKGVVIRKSFARAELPVKFKCDIHPWMSAYLGVFDHPFFAVSAADGSFAIPGLPEGEYTVEAWHEMLGVRSAKVEVDAGGQARLEFTFAGK